MTTINDISDFARILREHPEWRETVRGLVLGEEVSQLPQKLASFIEATHENFRLVHERMDRFEAGQSEMRTEIGGIRTEIGGIRTEIGGIHTEIGGIHTEIGGIHTEIGGIHTEIGSLRTDVNRLTGRVDNGMGLNYEVRVERVFAGIAKQRLGLSRPRILVGGRTGFSAELGDLMEDASDDGRLTSDEYADVQQIDFVSACRRDSDQTQVYFAAEISITASDSDIERVVRRSELLAKVTGRNVIPGIVSASVDAERQDLAQQQGVSVLAIAES